MQYLICFVAPKTPRDKMIISGKEASMFVKGLGSSQVQPAGIDLSLKEVRKFAESGEIDYDNTRRRISRDEAIQFGSEGKVLLPPGCYKIIYNEWVEVPLDCVAFGFPRSSLLRCGADVRCAVWDPGYRGRSESLLVVHNAHGIVLHKNAKVAQMVFVRMESRAEKGYTGKYLEENK
ncbi:MAG: deoxyuridine 5'-triphosphate nucleotidohydrolase [Candidatus Anstonellaceae archaeon]